jgi:hypothetical protein
MTHQGYYFLEFNTSWEVNQFKRIENVVNPRKKWFKFILSALNILGKYYNNLLRNFRYLKSFLKG